MSRINVRHPNWILLSSKDTKIASLMPLTSYLVYDEVVVVVSYFIYRRDYTLVNYI